MSSKKYNPRARINPVQLTRMITGLADLLEKLALKLRPPPATLHGMIVGSFVSQAIYVVAKLGIADLLEDGPKTSDSLARFTGVHPRSLYRVLRALSSVGVFAEDEGGKFRLTRLAKYLESDTPGSMCSLAIFNGEQFRWRSCGELLHSVRTGKPAFESVFGIEPYKYLDQNAEAAEIFQTRMAKLTAQWVDAITASCDFSCLAKVVDVGGGHGGLLSHLLRKNPRMRGVLFDQPSVIEQARRLFQAEGVSDRCELAAGDFFEWVPRHGDAYILKNVICDWDDDRALRILKNCRDSMTQNGRLLLVELVIAPGNKRSFVNIQDLGLMVMTGGGHRTEAEHRKLLESAGFMLRKVTSTRAPISVIEAVPV